MKRAPGVVALRVTALAAAALLLAGCSAASGGLGGSSDSSADSSANGSAGDSALPGGVTEIAPLAPGGSGEFSGIPLGIEDRAVVTTGTVSITADDPVGAAGDAVRLVTGAGGRIDARTEHPATDTQRAGSTLVIRVPADQLEGVLEKITLLGRVNSVTLSSADVTAQKQDIDARIGALQTSVDRLLTLMASATDTADLISIESALSGRQAELDSLTAQRDTLADTIDYSTVSVDFSAEGVVAAGGPDSFWSGLLTGWNALLGFLGGFIVVLGIVLPWLALVAVLAGIAALIVRAVRRRPRRPSDPGVV